MLGLSLGTAIDSRHRPRGVGASLPPLPEAPALVVAPHLTGTGRIGSVLRVDPGIWSGRPAPQLALQWARDGSPIPGAVETTYVPVDEDDRTGLSCIVTALNTAGAASVGTAPLSITHVPPVALGLPDANYAQNSGVQALNAFSGFTGASLSFGVTGDGVSIDPQTGLLSILTNALRDGIEVRVIATNSGGTATTTFRLTVSTTVTDDAVAPSVTIPPSLSGSGEIGTALAVDPGSWDGAPAPELTLQWRRDGADIDGATAAGYVPVAADDLAELCCAVTAWNPAGSLEAVTDPVRATHAAPAASGGLADLELTLGGNGAVVAAAQDFTGAALSFAVTGAGAVIDAATGALSLAADVARMAELVTVIATNSGGSATSAFRVTVSAAQVAPSVTIPPSLSGSGEIGTALAVDPGSWDGEPAPELTLQWRRDGADIDGATAAGYVPVAADDLAALCCAVTAWNPAGSLEAVTDPVRATHAAPAASGRLADLVLALGAGGAVVAAGDDFTGAALSFAVTGAGAVIDAATGALTIAADAARTAAPVTVTATNSGGSATSTFTVTVLAAPRATGQIADLVYEQDSGAQTVSAQAVFSGQDLVFSLDAAPAGVTVDAGVGLVTVPTADLLDQAVITMRASNGAGSAALSFKVTVRATVKDVAPSVTVPPSLSGSGVIGAALSVDPGVWSGTPAPELALQWRRDGADLPGATAAGYVPVAADDQAALRCAVTGRNSAGSLEAVTPAIHVTQPAPVATGLQNDLVIAKGSGVQVLPMAGLFSGAGLRFSVTGAGASIEATTGVLSLSTDAVMDELIRVTATNSGGSASIKFLVTVAVAPRRPEQGAWSITAASVDSKNYTGIIALDASYGATAVQYNWVGAGAPQDQYEAGWTDTKDLGNGTWDMGVSLDKSLIKWTAIRYKDYRASPFWSPESPNRWKLLWTGPIVSTGWYNLAVRTPEEYAQYGTGEPVQEGFQWFRSWDQAGEQVYLAHDVQGVWESSNDAYLIRPVRGLGNYANGAQSICIDPSNTDCFWVVGLAAGNAAATAIYFSDDKGATTFISYSIPAEWNAHGRNIGLFWANKNINVDPTTLSGATSLRRVYVVIQKMSGSPANADGAQVLTREPGAGNTWTLRATLTQSTHGNIYGIYPHPTRAGYVYMCTSRGLFKSTNYGASFSPIGAGIPAGGIREIWIAPTSSSSGTADTVIFAVEGQGVYKTTNSFSSNVTTLKSDSVAVRVAVSNVDAGYMFLLTKDNNGPYYSHNGGSSWTRGGQIGRPGSDSQQRIGGISGPYYKMPFIVPHYSDKNKAWAHASNILFRTTDGGVTWKCWADGFTGNRIGDGKGQPIGFDVADPKRFAVGLGDTTCVTTDGMTGYTQRKADPAFTPGDTPSCLCMGLEPSAGSNLLVATLGRVGGVGAVIRSTDYGVNWTEILADSKQYTLFWDKADTNFIYAGDRRSKDKGLTWSGAGHVICGLSADGLTVWGLDLGTNDTTIYKATNGHTSGSLTWSTVMTLPYRMYGGGSGVMGLQYFPPFASHPTNTSRFYTIASNGEIVRYDGITPTSPATGPLARAGGRDPVPGMNLKNGVVNICIDPQNPEIVYAFLKCTGLPWCYMSTDNGATWVDITENIPLYGATAGGGQVVHPLTGEVMVGWHLGTRVRRPPVGFSYTAAPISVAAGLKNLH